MALGRRLVYKFRGGPNDGAGPVDSLVFDQAGNIYSTTGQGGNRTRCSNGCRLYSN